MEKTEIDKLNPQEFILYIDSLSTKEFCDWQGIQHPYFTGDVKSSADLFLQIDTIKWRLCKEKAKSYSLPVSPNVSKVEDWDEVFKEYNSYYKNCVESDYEPILLDEWLRENYSLPASPTEPDGWVCNGIFMLTKKEADGYSAVCGAKVTPVYFTPSERKTKQISEVDSTQYSELEYYKAEFEANKDKCFTEKEVVEFVEWLTKNYTLFYNPNKRAEKLWFNSEKDENNIIFHNATELFAIYKNRK